MKNFTRKLVFTLKFLEIRLRFVAILVITALAVGYWDHIENYYERWQRQRMAAEHAGDTEVAESEFEYYCGMHPFVVRDRPGKCPVCGMDLTRRRKGEVAELPEGTVARVQVSPERVLQAGVQVEPVLYRLLARRVDSYGIIEVDETRVSNVVARFPGRIEELLVNSTGEVVKKGQPLAQIYTPQFLAGADEYVRALEVQRTLEANPRVSAKEKDRAAVLVDGARRRLKLAGFTEAQLDELRRTGRVQDHVVLYSPVAGTVIEKNVLEGQTVEEGTPLYTLADLSTLWIQALIIESDLAAVKVGMPVEVTSVSWPGEIFYGTVDFIYPVLETESRSVKVRIVVHNREGKLKPGMYVNTAMRAPVGRYGLAGELQLAMADYEGSPAHPEPEAAPAPADADAELTLPTETEEDRDRFLATLEDGDEYYYCSMCDEVVTDDPEHRCPICGMKLTRAVKGQEAGSEEPAEGPEPASSPGGLPTTRADAAEAFLATLEPGAEYYACPMDAEVVSDRPGECPLCGMMLEPTRMPTGEGRDGGTYDRWAEGYACPMHPDELDDTPGMCTLCGCGMEKTRLAVERVLSVPETAVVDTGMRKLVYVETEPGLFEARTVTLGSRTGAYYPVLDGLVLGQRIATHGSFLLDAEARLNPSISGLESSSAEPDGAAAHHHNH